MTAPPHAPRDADDLLRAALAGSARDAGPDCPDAETLAAYYERTLDTQARAAAEAHIAGCLACQASMAALVRSEPEPAVAPARGWLDWLAPRLAWAAPVVVAGLAAALWFAEQPLVVPDSEQVVASRATNEEAAATPAETAAPPAEPKAPGIQAADEPAAARETSSTAAPRRDAVRERAAEPPARDPRAATVEKLESRRAEPAPALAGRAVVAGQLAAAADTAMLAPVVTAPGGLALWRVDATGTIARSDDGGATWRDQRATGHELLAGSATSATVCWMVGRAGSVWRTTDGERWEPVGAPSDADLVAVDAASADQALVTAGDGRRWETTDGGRTWREQGGAGVPR